MVFITMSNVPAAEHVSKASELLISHVGYTEGDVPDCTGEPDFPRTCLYKCVSSPASLKMATEVILLQKRLSSFPSSFWAQIVIAKTTLRTSM